MTQLNSTKKAIKKKLKLSKLQLNTSYQITNLNCKFSPQNFSMPHGNQNGCSSEVWTPSSFVFHLISQIPTQCYTMMIYI